MRTGLVLEGGGMRGLFSMGIVDLMLEQQVRVDGVVGVSAGACFGCNYKSHQIGRALRYNIRLKDDPRYMSLRNLLTTGNLLSRDFCYHTVPEEIDVFDKVAFAADPSEFHVVCTDIVTGEAVYKRLDRVDYEALEWIRASSSMPLVSRPVSLDGRLLLDGGIVDSIPLAYAQSVGFGRNIVIMTQPRGFRKQPSRIVPLFRIFMRKYPKVAELMAVRHDMYNRQVEYALRMEAEGKALLIFPDAPLNIGRTELNEESMRRVYGEGRRIGEKMMEQIRTFVSRG